ncbi:MAG: 4-hydroxy-tetrahydrodipicolinate synthase [Termitinemataceae bacterium]|nr:MAG: 4-hydroxy-tetrahydrodipicolinate synthase [Termitinemataceae bacterium]
MLKLQGAFTALITPMTNGGAVDWDGWKKLIDYQLEGGIDGLVPIGTSGETPTLDEHEEEKLIKIIVEKVNGKVPIIAGAGSNSTNHAVQYTKRAKDLGADAALVVTPYYNKPNDSGLLRHFEELAKVGIPIIVYNIAGRAGRNIQTSLLEKIAQFPNIAGVKEASGDMQQMSDVMCNVAIPRKGNFVVLCGDDGLTVPLMSLGGNGVISVISNLLPSAVHKMTQYCIEGNFNEAAKIHFELSPFVKAAFIETNPVPIKAALSMYGLPAGPVRLPLAPLSESSEAIVKEALEGLKKTGFLKEHL